MSTRAESVHTINSALTQIMRRIRRVDDAQGMGRARLSALAVLHFGGPCSLSELARAEMVSRATMHHVVKALEEEALIRSSADPADARRQVIRLTPRGRRAIIRAHQARLDYLGDLAVDVPAADLATVAAVLDRIRRAAHETAGG